MHIAVSPITFRARKAAAPQGFTLLEVMIVVAVIAILAAVALPSYQDSLRKARRADAMLVLTDTAQRLERCYAECNSYTATCPAACPSLPITSSDGHYQITTAAGSAIAASTFTLVATPVSGGLQASDAACTSFTLTHLNVKSATGTGAAQCWKR